MTGLVDEARWVPIIGQLMLTFSEIEGVTLNLLKKWTNEPIFRHLKKLQFKPRIKLLADLAPFQNHTEENKAFLIQLLRELEQLVEYRNLVAHNSVSIVLFIEEESTPFREGICKSDKDHVVEFDELSEVLQRVQRINEGLSEAFVRFWAETANWSSAPPRPLG